MIYQPLIEFYNQAGYNPEGNSKGLWAFRYKQHFFLSYLRRKADIHRTGERLASMIPRDPEEQEEWIKRTIRAIEDKLLWRAERGIPVGEVVKTTSPPRLPGSDKDQVIFMQVIPAHNTHWLRPKAMEDWTYVIDLEDRIFTINGYINFRFSDMPPSCSQYIRALGHYRDSICTMSPDVPGKHVAPVRRWPNPSRTPDPEYIEAYDTLSLAETPLSEWGVRGWDELNTSEALSTCLVATILLDQSSQIRNPDLVNERRMFTYCQWQILTAAAPSAVTISPFAGTDWESIQYNSVVHIALTVKESSWPNSKLASGSYWKEPPPMWFRGCLIMLCRRLDTLGFVKAEVYRLIQHLRSSRRAGTLGLLFDGELVVGVSLDGVRIRRSPVLQLYDCEMKLREGMLLLMHLLSPVSTINKTPWRASSLPRARANLPLPFELIARVTQLVDYDTYSNLQYVSHGFRSIYLSYPRLDNMILLGSFVHEPDTFNILNTTSGEQYWARLSRTNCTTYPTTLGQNFCHRQCGLGMGFYTPADLDQWYLDYKQSHPKNRYDCPDRPAGTSMFRTTLVVGGRCWPTTDEREPWWEDESWWEVQEVKTQVVLGRWEFRRLDTGLGRWDHKVKPWSDG